MTAFGNIFYWPFNCIQLLVERLVFISCGNQIWDFWQLFFIQQRVKQLLGKRTHNHATRSLTNAPLKCLCPLACWKHSLRSCEDLIIAALHKGKACIFVLVFCSLMKLMTCSRRPYNKYCVAPEDWNSIFSFFVRSFLFTLSVYLRIATVPA